MPARQALWSAEFTVNAPTNAPRGRSRRLRASGVINFSSFERVIEYLRVDGDWAITMGTETVTPIGDAPLSGLIVQRRFTNVWEQEAGTAVVYAPRQ